MNRCPIDPEPHAHGPAWAWPYLFIGVPFFLGCAVELALVTLAIWRALT